MGSSYSRRAQSRRRRPSSLEPLIERLDRIEARFGEAERRPTPEPSGKLSAEVAAVRASLVSIDERLAAQSREIESLRIREETLDKRISSRMTALENKLLEHPEPAAAPGPVPAPEPLFFFELPFEREVLKQALAGPDAPVSESDTLRWRRVREDERSRRPQVTPGLF